MATQESIMGWLYQAGAKQIRETGENNTISTCPFHRDNNPSFSMRTDNGLFLCYAAGCGASGNLITFLMTALKWSFKKAKNAAEKQGIVSLDDPSVYTLPDYADRHDVEVEDAPLITEGWLGVYDFKPRYMVKRGFTTKVLRKWGIGYDFGTSRVTIPVRDSTGKLVGISKRSTQDEHGAKYLHLGFKRGHYLYGSHLLDGKALKKPVVSLTEGQLDVLAWDQSFRMIAGEVSPLSTMGSRVTPTQIKWVAKNCRQAVLAFDNDADGRATTIDVGDKLLQRMSPRNVFAISWWPEGVKDVGDLLKASDKVKQQVWDSLAPYTDVRQEWMLYKHKGDLRERKTRNGFSKDRSRRKQKRRVY